MHELLINFTPTGMVPTKEQTPHVPVQPAEIIEQVLEAHELGITIAHLHARDQLGAPTHRREVYANIFDGIRRYAPDLILCASLSGRNVSDPQLRADPLYLEGDARPDMGSLTLSSLNFTRQASPNSPQTIVALAEAMRSRGVMPELEAFDLGMVNYANYLLRKGFIESPCYMNLILGNIAGAQCSLGHMASMLQDLPADCLWSFGGIGAAQLPAAAVAVAMGGGVRIGLEDNLRLRGRLTTNRELIETVHELARIHDRPIMTPQHARQRLRMQAYESSTILDHGRRQGRAVA